jgi:hypothetical protein
MERSNLATNLAIDDRPLEEARWVCGCLKFRPAELLHAEPGLCLDLPALSLALTFAFDLSWRQGALSFVSGPELVLARIARPGDEIPAEILLGGEGVVGAAAKGDVAESMFAALRESHRVM